MTEISDDEKRQVANRSTWVSAVVNILLSLGQLIAGFLTHSQGLIADGLHSLSDLVSDGVVLLANRHSHVGPDEDHHYGHARYENAASLVIGLLLLGVGAAMAFNGVMSIQSIDTRPPIHEAALWTAGITLLAKEALFRYMLSQAKRVGSSLLIANAWHARSDAASSLVVAIGIGGSLLGYPVTDPIAGLVVGLIICKMGLEFSWTALSQLMDRALPSESVDQIRTALQHVPGVVNVHDLRTRHMGDMAIVDAHLDVAPWISVSEGHWVAAHARQALIALPMVMDAQIHIDPATGDASIGAPLPVRADIESWLSQLTDKPMVESINLHYLDGKLLLEVIVGEPCEESRRLAFEKALADRWGPLVEVARWLLLIAKQPQDTQKQP